MDNISQVTVSSLMVDNTSQQWGSAFFPSLFFTQLELLSQKESKRSVTLLTIFHGKARIQNSRSDLSLKMTYGTLSGVNATDLWVFQPGIKAAYGFLIYALESNFFPFPLHHLKVVLKYQLIWSSLIPLLSEVVHILSGGS